MDVPANASLLIDPSFGQILKIGSPPLLFLLFALTLAISHVASRLQSAGSRSICYYLTQCYPPIPLYIISGDSKKQSVWPLSTTASCIRILRFGPAGDVAAIAYRSIDFLSFHMTGTFVNEWQPS
ncbi:hypothetical protein GGI43DRAFT_392320 [Trichoderma evansii]